MEDFYINNTSRANSYNYSNITSDYNVIFQSYDFNGKYGSTMNVVTYIIIGIGLPLTLVAIYALFSLVEKEHVAPIYVINLLISDLIQFCCLIIQVVPLQDMKISEIFIYIYLSGLLASVGFMVCIAQERYLVIAFPLWYRFRRSIKTSVVVCVVVWAFPLVFFFTFLAKVDSKVPQIVSAVFLLLPLPLLIFFLGGTLKALSASQVPSDEKQRIVGVLVLVLLTYMLLFLPTIIGFLSEGARNNATFRNLYVMFIRLSPLADLFLYVFMRKGAIDKLLASVCCCRMDSNDISSLPV